MTIRKLENGSYEIKKHRRHPITKMPMTLKRLRRTRKEAVKAEEELVILLHERCKEEIMPRWRENCDAYLKSMELQGYSKSTIRDYSTCLKKYTYDIWGDRFIDDITSHEISGLIKDIGESKSKGHQKNVLKFIRGAFNYSLESGVMKYNPTPRMKIKINSKEKRVLTIKQQAFFLEKARELDSKWLYVWILACFTGMRTGELYALRWGNVQLEGRKEDMMIYVCSNWTKADGYKDLTKSGDDRKVPISNQLKQVLLEIKENVDEGEFVLPRIRKWTTGHQAEDLRFFLSGIGLPEIRFHDLRAGWATRLLVDGVAPAVVMKIGGWKDLKTMQRYIRKSGIDIEGGIDSIKFQF